MQNEQIIVGPDGWDRRFLGLAEHVAGWSKDPSTKVGCVIVGPDREVRSTGFNGFPRGIADTPERLNNREIKYKLVVHGEMNAILHAARIGMSLKGCTAYTTLPSCSQCAIAIIQAGIVEAVYPDGLDIPDRWKIDFDLGSEYLNEGGVKIRKVRL
jgi:dCMP deaminase